MIGKKELDKRLTLQIIILLGVVWLCYWPSISSFFLADDIWQVSFAHKVFDGRTELIWRNFTSNYLQLPSFDFYRPLMGFTFLFDYFLNGARPAGYHLTNITLYSIISVLMLFLMRALTKSWPRFNAEWASFLTALLFALSPLHCEDVAWISGRADILSAPFYLAALYCIVRSHQEKNRKLYWIGLAGFWGAILSKEIAIGLPAVIAAYYFIWPEEDKFSELVEKESPAKEEALQVESNAETEPDAPKPKGATAAQIAHAERALKKGKKRRKKKGAKADEDSTESDPTGAETKAAGGKAVGGKAAGAEAPNEGTRAEAVGEEEAPGKRPSSKWSFAKRLILSLKMAAPFLVSAAVYMGIRYNALGTFIGGYGGMMGGALGRHLLLRWLDPVNAQRILLPFAKSITPPNLFPQWITLICLATGILIVLFRFLLRANPTKWIAFLFIWMLTGVLPLAKLWGIGMDLETSRLLFFFTMGLSALLPVLMFHPPQSKLKLPAVANRSLGYVAAFDLLIICITFAWATFATNYLWLGAGQEFERLWLSTIDLTTKLKPNEKVIVLGIPKDYKGAHVNFNGSTFHHMLRPPFVPTPLSDMVITFEPFIVGPYEVINSDRLKTLMSVPNVKGPFVWKRKELKFEQLQLGGKTGLPEDIPLPFQSAASSVLKDASWRFDGKGTAELKNDKNIVINDTGDGAILKIDKLDINPMEVDFLEFEIKAKLKKGDKRILLPFAVGWNTSSKDVGAGDWAVVALHTDKLSEFSTFRLHLGHYWQWYAAGTIKSLVIRLFDAQSIEVRNVSLRKKTALVPFFAAKDLKSLNSGEYILGSEPLVVLFDGHTITGAETVEIEITKPNYFFDNYLIGSGDSPITHRLAVPLARGATALKPDLFPEPAYYELRLRCLDKNNHEVGAWSEYITVLKMGSGLDTYVF